MFVVIITTLLVSCVSAVESESKFPTASESCNNAPWCDFKGVEHNWPSLSDDQDLAPFSNLTFIVQLPRHFDKISILWGKLPMFVAQYNQNKIAISVEEIPPIDIKADTPLKESGKIQPSEIFNTIFTKTPADTEPQNSRDQALWRTAFMMKAKQFKSASDATIYENGPWSAYTAKVEAVTHNRITIVTHNEIAGRYLAIRDSGVDGKIIENIIATIKLDR
jgi:hypothetical protein